MAETLHRLRVETFAHTMRAMKRALLAAMLCSCAFSNRVRGPDGTDDWYAISCRKSQGYCWDEAGNVCPYGYDVADSSQREGVFLSSTPQSTIVRSTHHGELLVHCHPEPANDQLKTRL